jgi:hypothetical protein
MPTDMFEPKGRSLDSPIENAFAVTPNDSTDLTISTRGIYVGSSGALKVTTVRGDEITFTNLAAGIIHPIRVARVWSTGTTASSIVGVF